MWREGAASGIDGDGGGDGDGDSDCDPGRVRSVAPEQQRREPLRCPASSSRAGWPSRVRALGDDRYAKLWGRRPRLVEVDADGHLLGQTELGARRPTDTRALACGRGRRLAAAWIEYRGDRLYALRVAVRSSGGKLSAAQTVDAARAVYDYEVISGLALAYAPDGSLLVAYGVFREVRGVIVAPSGDAGPPFKLGPAAETTQIAAEIGRRGRAVVAWTTIDAGEERNERRRVYAVTRERGATAFGRARLVHRAKYLNIIAYTDGTRDGDPARGRAERPRAADVGHRPRLRHRRGLLRARQRGRSPRAFRGFAPARGQRLAGRRRDPLRRHGTRRLSQRRPAASRRPRGRGIGSVHRRSSRARIAPTAPTAALGGRPRVEWQSRGRTWASTRDAP